MSGRRLLDLARIAGAARNVATQHVLLRQQQLKVFNQTSSIWKLAGAGRQQFSQYQPAADKSIPSKGSVQKPEPSAPGKKLDDEVFHDRSPTHTADDPVPSKSIHIEQEEAKTSPLADGTIPPIDSSVAEVQHDVDSPIFSASEISQAEHDRRAQRQAEDPIPKVEAEPPEVKVQQDTDVYHSSRIDSSPVLSSLPRVKVPKNTSNVEGSDEHVADKDLNQDVFYSSQTAEDTKKTQDDDLPEEVYAELFHSRKVAGKLGGQASPYQFRKSKPQEQNKSTSSRHPLDTRPVPQDENVAKLAEDIAKDATSPPPVSRPHQVHKQC